MYGIKVQHYGEKPQLMAHRAKNQKDALQYIRQQLAIAQTNGKSTGEVADRFIIFGEGGVFETQFWPVPLSQKSVIFYPQLIPDLMDGLITETRRVFKKPPPEWVTRMKIWKSQTYEFAGTGDHPNFGQTTIHPFMPKYRPGDLLWVKEGWATFPEYDYLRPSELTEGSTKIFYLADGDDRFIDRHRSPLFMPRWASRIELTVTGVDAQRVQSITREQAIASGLESVQAYRELWDMLNKKRGFGWDANPWTWVYKIQRTK